MTTDLTPEEADAAITMAAALAPDLAPLLAPDLAPLLAVAIDAWLTFSTDTA